MNIQQNKQLHTLLAATGLMEQKANLVFGFSHGRGESSKDLTYAEADEMIDYLQRQKAALDAPANKMRRRILSMAHEMHWTASPNPSKGGENEKPKIDMNRVNGWCEKFGYLHKKLNDYSYLELPKLVTQFSAVYSDFLKKI